MSLEKSVCYKHIFHYVSLAQLEKAAYGEMETVLTNQRGTLYYLCLDFYSQPGGKLSRTAFMANGQ